MKSFFARRTEPPQVVNIHHGEYYTIYIGRSGHSTPGYLGNPVVVGDTCPVCGKVHLERGSTLICFELYARRQIAADPEYRTRIRELRGHRLGCFCAPKPCHGDILAALCEELNKEEGS